MHRQSWFHDFCASQVYFKLLQKNIFFFSVIDMIMKSKVSNVKTLNIGHGLTLHFKVKSHLGYSSIIYLFMYLFIYKYRQLL